MLIPQSVQGWLSPTSVHVCCLFNITLKSLNTVNFILLICYKWFSPKEAQQSSPIVYQTGKHIDCLIHVSTAENPIIIILTSTRQKNNVCRTERDINLQTLLIIQSSRYFCMETCHVTCYMMLHFKA